MTNTSLTALTLLIAWALVLLIVMELLRVRLVVSGAFRPGDTHVAPEAS